MRNINYPKRNQQMLTDASRMLVTSSWPARSLSQVCSDLTYKLSNHWIPCNHKITSLRRNSVAPHLINYWQVDHYIFNEIEQYFSDNPNPLSEKVSLYRLSLSMGTLVHRCNFDLFSKATSTFKRWCLKTSFSLN